MENNRREFLTLSAVAATGTSLLGREFRGRFNYQTMDFYPFRRTEVEGGKCLVDGKEIKNVWFADTEMGIVRTYDVLHDGLPATATAKGNRDYYKPSDFPGREVACPFGGVLSETLRGCVRILGAF